MEGALFDFNGTLIFDDEINYKAWNEVCIQMIGSPLSKEDYNKINGTNAKFFMDFIYKRESTKEEFEKYAKIKEIKYREALLSSNIELAPGAIKFFEELKSKNIPFQIATSSCKNNVDAYITKFNLEKWFDIDKITYFDGTFKGKPNPDIYLIAAKKIGVDIKNCIVFEDADNGIKAGKSAGATVVGIAGLRPLEIVKNNDGVSMAFKDFSDINVELLNNIFK